MKKITLIILFATIFISTNAQKNVLANGLYRIKVSDKYMTADFTPVTINPTTTHRDNTFHKESRSNSYFYGAKPKFVSDLRTDGSQLFYIIKLSGGTNGAETGNYKIISYKKATYNNLPQWVHLNEYSNVSIREISQSRHLHEIYYDATSGKYAIDAMNTGDSPNVKNFWSYDATNDEVIMGSTTISTEAYIFDLVPVTTVETETTNQITDGNYRISIAKQYLTSPNSTYTDNRNNIYYTTLSATTNDPTQLWAIRLESNGKYSISGKDASGADVHIGKDGLKATGAINLAEETFDVIYDGQFYCLWSVLADRSLMLNNDLNSITYRQSKAINTTWDTYGKAEKLFIVDLERVSDLSTGTDKININQVKVRLQNNKLMVQNYNGMVSVFNIAGQKIKSVLINSGEETDLNLNQGVYMIQCGQFTQKVIL